MAEKIFSSAKDVGKAEYDFCDAVMSRKLVHRSMLRTSMAEKIFSSAKDVGKAEYDFCDAVMSREILFAEDSKAIQKYMGMVFEQLGLKHRGFDNGRLLLDYVKGLEDMSGISMILPTWRCRRLPAIR